MTKPREEYFFDQIGAADQAVGGVGQAIGEKGPGDQGGVAEDRVGHAVGGHLGQAAEEDAEDDHGEKGLQDSPAGAQHGLLVADLDITPGQEVGQVAVLPEIAQVELGPSPWTAGCK